MSVTPREILTHQIKTMHFVIKKVIDDISEVESLKTIGTSPNHIKWQTGHLVFTALLAGKALGGEFEAPQGWDKLFGRGEGLSRSATDFPTMDTLRSTLYDFQIRVLLQAEKASEDHLTTKRTISGSWEDTPLNAVLFLCGHDFYHCGQIALIRRELGRERSFG